MTTKAIMLVNLGSPDTPDIPAVRRYLNQFLMDPYVIQLPWLIRRLIVSLLVLPTRPRASSEAYHTIWQPEGSPLLFLSHKLHHAIAQKVTLPVALAMRYGQPSIESTLLDLAKNTALKDILFIPLYPHFADSTVTTSVEEAQRVIRAHKLNITLTVQPPFYDQTDYIQALVHRAQPYLTQDYDHLLFSYHGLPESHITRLDASGQHCLKTKNCCNQPHPAHRTCYRHQVLQTTKQFVAAAHIPKQKWSVAFQSRLGRAKWLGPNTEDRIRQLAESGHKHILVICPAFVTDCLETLEEIAIRGQTVFREAGGERLTLIPCLNDDPEWVNVLSRWIENYTRPNKG